MRFGKYLCVVILAAVTGCAGLQLQSWALRVTDATEVLNYYGDQAATFCDDISAHVDEYHLDPDLAAVHKAALESRCAFVAEKYVAFEDAIIRLRTAVRAGIADPTLERAEEIKRLVLEVEAAQREFVDAVKLLTHSSSAA